MNDKKTTKDFLADSLKALMMSKPFEKITIKQITDKAGVIRVTFYNHFVDKYDTLEYIAHRDLFETDYRLIETKGIDAYFLTMLKELESSADFYRIAIHLDGLDDFRKIMQRQFDQLLLQVLKNYGKKVDSGIVEKRVIRYYSSGLCALVLDWLSQAKRESAEQFYQSVRGMMTHHFFDFLQVK